MTKKQVTYAAIILVVLLIAALWIKSVLKKKGSGGQLEQDAQWLIAEIDKAA